MKLNLGCGSKIINGWCNVDYSLGAKLTKVPFFGAVNRKLGVFNLNWDKNIVIHDLRKKFPWASNSIDSIYSSHTLEHLSKQQGEKFLNECYRVLKNGCITRIVVPDLKQIVSQYTSEKIPAENFLSELGVLYNEYSNKTKNKFAPFIQFPHKCMYDTVSLLRIMTNIGFKASSKNAFESEIQDIHSIELKNRTYQAVIVEGTKE